MIRTYDTPLLRALDAAVDAARQDGPVVAKTDVCPTCDGAGRVVVRRYVGTTVTIPVEYDTCHSCSGTGEVSADAVVHCTDCDAAVWVDQACTHQLGTLCPDHAPACVECTGTRGDR